jgi:hypothetical protein
MLLRHTYAAWGVGFLSIKLSGFQEGGTTKMRSLHDRRCQTAPTAVAHITGIFALFQTLRLSPRRNNFFLTASIAKLVLLFLDHHLPDIIFFFFFFFFAKSHVLRLNGQLIDLLFYVYPFSSFMEGAIHQTQVVRSQVVEGRCSQVADLRPRGWRRRGRLLLEVVIHHDSGRE